MILPEYNIYSLVFGFEFGRINITKSMAIRAIKIINVINIVVKTP